ncbi:MAG: Transcriptional regulator, TetR family [uncultured Thiotrichaceae bacterium]|uniref:Transcriptional regulator, TetR family n=1 Tax=uncultured Thiotrichaceae bacterium TaxID=298394 RepID=A0A6S6TRN0_9GAMM|nr:MAG: Transcriptional regulator, TetR family [uncultured Thiotrichaceae bacterium]
MTNISASKRKPGRPAKGGLEFGDTREALLRSGTELLTEKGFNSTGLDEILKRVNVPKGSFYHYFKNKEAYGCAVIDNYSQYFIKKLNSHLLNEEHPALDRLQAFMQDAMQGMEKYDYKRGCLIGNMTQELGSTNACYRDKLSKAFAIWQSLVADCLELAKQQGALAKDTDSTLLADFFWIGWEGAVMRSKLSRDNKPLELFSAQFFQLLPKP